MTQAKRRGARRRGYRETLRFVIMNDADMTETTDAQELFGNMSIAAIAFAFGMDEFRVCNDIVRMAKKMYEEEQS